MSGINTGRVILGGLLAGVVLNVSEFILNMFVIGEERSNELFRRSTSTLRASVRSPHSSSWVSSSA